MSPRILIPNVTKRRRRRTGLTWCGVIAAGFVVGGLASRDLGLALGGPLIVIFGGFPEVFALDLSRMPHAQPYVEVGANGVAYGDRYRIPWSVVTKLEVLPRRHWRRKVVRFRAPG